jgi:hypothetical protein
MRNRLSLPVDECLSLCRCPVRRLSTYVTIGSQQDAAHVIRLAAIHGSRRQSLRPHPLISEAMNADKCCRRNRAHRSFNSARLTSSRSTTAKGARSWATAAQTSLEDLTMARFRNSFFNDAARHPAEAASRWASTALTGRMANPFRSGRKRRRLPIHFSWP